MHHLKSSYFTWKELNIFIFVQFTDRSALHELQKSDQPLRMSRGDQMRYSRGLNTKIQVLVMIKVFRFQRKTLLLLHWLRLFIFFWTIRRTVKACYEGAGPNQIRKC